MNYATVQKNQLSCPLCMHDVTKDSWYIDQTNNFYLVAALAPYSKNHYMIVSKKHYISVIDMPDKVYSELMMFQRTVCKFLYAQWHKEVVRLLRDTYDVPKWVFKLWPQRSTTWKSLAHFHTHCIPDTQVTATRLVDQNTSDSRELGDNDQVSIMKANRQKYTAKDCQ